MPVGLHRILRKQEVTMRVKKAFMVSIFLLAAVLLVQPGFSQERSEKTISFSGLIDSIPKDSNYIVVNEARVLVTDAKIVSDKGNLLGIRDLRPGLYVTVEAVQKPNNVSAKKVTVISAPSIPKNVKKTP
jgi:hypothetical protein